MDGTDTSSVLVGCVWSFPDQAGGQEGVDMEDLVGGTGPLPGDLNTESSSQVFPHQGAGRI